MATNKRNNRVNLTNAIIKNAPAFDFFQATRLLHLDMENSKQVGYANTKDNDALLFKTSDSLSFPGIEIEKTIQKTDGKLEVVTPLFGLTGINGSLPTHYTMLIKQQSHLKNNTLNEFLQIFNHRLIAFYYQVWKRYRLHIEHEHQARFKKNNSPITTILSSLSGNIDCQDPLITNIQLYHTSQFAQTSRSAANFKQILQSYLSLKIQIKEFIGSWQQLSSSQYTSMPTKNSAGSFNQLAINSIAGSRVWCSQNKIRIVIGPIEKNHLTDFLPHGMTYKTIHKLVKLFCPSNIKVEIQLLVKATSYQVFKLGADSSSMLGWNSWLSAKRDKQAYLDEIVLS